MTTPAPVIVAAETIDIRHCPTFQEQHRVLREHAEGRPAGTPLTLNVGANFPPPEGWAHTILWPGYRWAFTGDRDRVREWQQQYAQELQMLNRRRQERGA